MSGRSTDLEREGGNRWALWPVALVAGLLGISCIERRSETDPSSRENTEEVRIAEEPAARPGPYLSTAMLLRSCRAEVLSEGGRGYLVAGDSPRLLRLESATGDAWELELSNQALHFRTGRVPHNFSGFRRIVDDDGDALWVVADYAEFVPGPSRLLASRDGRLIFASGIRHDLSVRDAWRWDVKSILALVEPWPHGPIGFRTVGPAPPPSVAVLRGQAECRGDVNILPVGVSVEFADSVHALLSCGGRVWLGNWEYGDPRGRFSLLGDYLDLGRVASAGNGTGYAAAYGEGRPRLYRWSGDDIENIACPPDAVEFLDVDSHGRPWMRSDDTLFRLEGATWKSEPIGARLAIVDGIRYSTPWALSSDRRALARTNDGAWDVAHLQVPEGWQTVVPQSLVVAGPDVAHVIGCETPGGMLDPGVLLTSR